MTFDLRVTILDQESTTIDQCGTVPRYLADTEFSIFLYIFLYTYYRCRIRLLGTGVVILQLTRFSALELFTSSDPTLNLQNIFFLQKFKL